MKKTSWRYAWFDPASGGFSGSRFLIWIIVIIGWPLNLAIDLFMRWFGFGKLDNWAYLAAITASIAGIYAVSTHKAKPKHEGED